MKRYIYKINVYSLILAIYYFKLKHFENIKNVWTKCGLMVPPPLVDEIKCSYICCFIKWKITTFALIQKKCLYNYFLQSATGMFSPLPKRQTPDTRTKQSPKTATQTAPYTYSSGSGMFSPSKQSVSFTVNLNANVRFWQQHKLFLKWPHLTGGKLYI